ncbi:hypothetical protein QBC46DRAFT_395918 [Diplogelasinospora grovesii]|uniref:Uncharacterized protein n=1 Tax=Diplogelasinospora grovesii TaxID=303347 RepID=A0AAN6S0N8_9PEZI|nr:hypothetical protein QBC46DRAFT_395918 [Diplogelasinospora grovesii]
MKGHAQRLSQHRPQRWWMSLFIVVVEYTLALASIVLQTWELGLQTFCSVWPSSFLGPIIWVVLRFFLHLLGMLLARLGIRRDGGGIAPGQRIGFWRWVQTVLPWCRDGFGTGNLV